MDLPQLVGQDTGRWAELVADADFQYTLTGALVDNGWLGLLPFLALLGGALGLALADARLPRLPRALAPFARFEARDHLGDPQRTIRQNLDAWLAGRGIDLEGGRVLMLAHARVLGHVFNPITVYWCHTADGAPA